MKNGRVEKGITVWGVSGNDFFITHNYHLFLYTLEKIKLEMHSLVRGQSDVLLTDVVQEQSIVCQV